MSRRKHRQNPGHTRERQAMRIEEQDRKDTMKEAKARQNKLKEKHGEATDTVEDPQGNTQEVSGADCPDCDNGVIVVSPQRDSYPPFKEVCTECGEK